MCRFLFVALVVVGSWGAAPAKAEIIQFKSADVPTSPFKARMAARQGKPAPPSVAGDVVSAEITKPVGPGPYPAVILFSAAGGWNDTPAHWPALLNKWGYVVVKMLSFATRGIQPAKRWHTRQARPNVAVRDAVGAIRMLRTVSYADASRVAVMGWSWGAAAALKSIEREGWMKRFGERPRAAVALYPRCDGSADYVSPSMILMGAKDKETSPALCVGLIEGAPVGSELPELVLYRGAHHQFDDPNAPDAVIGGVYRAFNPKAAANAEARIRAFFMKYL